MPVYRIKFSGKESSASEGIEYGRTKREAVEHFYRDRYDENYFPQPDDSILDCRGELIADSESDIIEYADGYFYAEEYNDEDDE